eukprot:jgi/Mesvir1/24052/Mv10784-RA.1
MAERNAYAASSSKSPLPRSSQSQNRYPPGGGGSFTFLSEDQDHDALQSGNFRYRRDPATTSRPSSRSSPSYNAVGGYMQGQPPLRSPKSTTTTDVAPAPRMRPRAPGLPSRPSQGIMSSGGVASAMGLAPRSDFLDREALRASLDSGLGHHDGDQGGYRPAMAWGGSERQGGSSSAAGLAPAPPVRAAWTSHGTHAMSSGRPSAAVRPSTGATPLSPPSVWGDLRGGTGTGTSRTAAFQSMEEDVPSITQGGSTRVPTASSERHARGGARRAPFTRSRPSASHGSREQWTDGSERSGVDAGAAQSTLRGSGEEVQLDREGRGTVTKKGRGARSANYLTRGAGPRGINTISLSSSVTNRGIEEESIGLEISLSDYMAALETTPAPSSATPASQELWGDLDMSVAHNGAEGPRLVIQGAADASDLELAVRGLSLRERSAASSSNGGTTHCHQAEGRLHALCPPPAHPRQVMGAQPRPSPATLWVMAPAAALRQHLPTPAARRLGPAHTWRARCDPHAHTATRHPKLRRGLGDPPRGNGLPLRRCTSLWRTRIRRLQLHRRAAVRPAARRPCSHRPGTPWRPTAIRWRLGSPRRVCQNGPRAAPSPTAGGSSSARHQGNGRHPRRCAWTCHRPGGVSRTSTLTAQAPTWAPRDPLTPRDWGLVISLEVGGSVDGKVSACVLGCWFAKGLYASCES